MSIHQPGLFSLPMVGATISGLGQEEHEARSSLSRATVWLVAESDAICKQQEWCSRITELQLISVHGSGPRMQSPEALELHRQSKH